jgi:hypothetical protein
LLFNSKLAIFQLYHDDKLHFDEMMKILLDAKSAFDVVDIDILMRKLHLLDIQPSTWKIIDNLHHDTRTCIKWKQQVSDSFDSFLRLKLVSMSYAILYSLINKNLQITWIVTNY